jgi:sulfotransferase family protein
VAIQPLFLFSLPRTGSTLVQRVLASHESIRTVAENGLLLHLLAPLRDPPPSGGEGWESRVALWYRRLVFEKVCDQLPEGRADVVAELRALTLRLFTKLADRDSGYFLDKTYLELEFDPDMLRNFSSITPSWTATCPAFTAGVIIRRRPRCSSPASMNTDRGPTIGLNTASLPLPGRFSRSRARIRFTAGGSETNTFGPPTSRSVNTSPYRCRQASINSIGRAT